VTPDGPIAAVLQPVVVVVLVLMSMPMNLRASAIYGSSLCRSRHLILMNEACGSYAGSITRPV
jgi:hypothetical protein